MRRYRLLAFRDHRLIEAETIEANSDIEAVQACAGRQGHNRLELWSNEGRVAILSAVGRHHDDERPRPQRG
jgi:hypothetical protein